MKNKKQNLFVLLAKRSEIIFLEVPFGQTHEAVQFEVEFNMF